MENYDLELSIALSDHGYRQALGLQAKTGLAKSKILKMYRGGNSLINSDGSVAAAEFRPPRRVRINLIGHGDTSSTTVSDTEAGDARTWEPAALARDVLAAVRWALPAYTGMFDRLSLIVCYGGGHTYTTKNEYGHHIHPSNSFGYRFFDAAKSWVRDVTARGDISTTSVARRAGSSPDTLNFRDFLGAHKTVGTDRASKDKYRKVRFYQHGGTIQVEWPYLGYDD